MFGLDGPLNRRDESAQSCTDLFEEAKQPRLADDMLARTPLEDNVESVVAGVLIRPADEPLDEIDAKWSAGMLSLLVAGWSLWKVRLPRLKAKRRPPSKERLRAAGL